jgi:rhodanese-related sulfurtransferase
MNRSSEISVGELHDKMASKEPFHLIDVREFPEFAAGRPPGARLIPLREIDRRATGIDPTLPIYVFCRTGRRSAEAREKLLSLGFGEVRNVAGGIVAWQNAGYPLEKEERAPWSLERQVRVAAGSLVLLGALLAVFVESRFIWLSAFVGAGLVFAGVTDFCGMSLLLSRLPWNRPSQRTGGRPESVRH